MIQSETVENQREPEGRVYSTRVIKKGTLGIAPYVLQSCKQNGGCQLSRIALKCTSLYYMTKFKSRKETYNVETATAF